MLSKRELDRYGRQLLIDGFGDEGQEKLRKARVLIAGAGGLASPAAIYLGVAGIGNIRIVDNDVVELSNLNRQILHWERDIGKKKVHSVREKLQQVNTDIKIETIVNNINENNILQLIEDCDLVLDAVDNYPTRYILNKAAITKSIPFIHGSVYGFEGMATTVIPRQTACLRCIFPQAPGPGVVPVIGVTPAIIGCLQATEAIKYIVGLGELLSNRLLLFNGLSMEFSEVKLQRNPRCPDCSQ